MSNDNSSPRQRRGRRAKKSESDTPSSLLSAVGGQVRLLADSDLERIHEAALSILEETGIAEAPPLIVDLVTAAGGEVTPQGRLSFPRALVERVLDVLPQTIALHGRQSRHDLSLGGDRVHVGTGGASPEYLDYETGTYRPSTLADIHRAARLVDQLPHIHFFSRPMVARDIEDPLRMEVNTAWACLAGTTKHVVVSASSVAAVDAIAEMAHMVAGSPEAFRAAPFLSLNINHIVPPLRFDADAALVLARALSAAAGDGQHFRTAWRLEPRHHRRMCRADDRRDAGRHGRGGSGRPGGAGHLRTATNGDRPSHGRDVGWRR